MPVVELPDYSEKTGEIAARFGRINAGRTVLEVAKQEEGKRFPVAVDGIVSQEAL